MERETFQKEILRLKTEWPNSFGEARMLRLWELYRQVPCEVFREAVTALLDGHRGGAPVPKDFEAPIERARQAWKMREFERDYKGEKSSGAEEPNRSREDYKALLQDLFKRMDGLRSGSPDPDDRQRELKKQIKLVCGREKAARNDD